MFRWALSQDIVETDPTAGLTAYDRGTPRDRVLTVRGNRDGLEVVQIPMPFLLKRRTF